MESDLNLGYALIAGLISFLSPCVLPIVPPTLAWLAGVSIGEMREHSSKNGISWSVFQSALAYVLGFTTVFVLLGAASGLVGQWIGAENILLLNKIAGVIIIVMGLHFIGVFKIGFLFREARFHLASKPAGLLGAYILGLAFAFGWTPCIGPILASILVIANNEATLSQGMLLLIFYSLGLGLPFLAFGLFTPTLLGWFDKFKRHMRKVEIFMGLLLIIAGYMIFTGDIQLVAGWMLDHFSYLSTLG